MAIQAFAESVICSRCGMKFPKRKGYFPINYSGYYKGTGSLHICKTCLEDIYNKYYAECENTELAVRQTCRALNLYWSKEEYDFALKSTSTSNLITAYLSNLRKNKNVNFTYDDTLRDEGTLWIFNNLNAETQTKREAQSIQRQEAIDDFEITDDIINFWGSGYDTDMYYDLQKRYEYWMSEFPDRNNLDIGTKAIIKQICSLELDINRDRAAGRPVDKSVNALNTLLGSANLKPAQKKTDADSESELANTPMGVWLWRYENKRPLPEIDDSLRDVNGIKKYVFTWMGHLCKMLNIKNTFTKMYEEEVERLRVEKPEYEDEDDETLLIDAYSENESGDDDDS